MLLIEKMQNKTFRKLIIFADEEVADEEIAFSSVGITFTKSVENRYFDIAFCISDDNDKSYQNLIKLYKLWNNRIKKEKLTQDHHNLSEQLQMIESIEIKPLGTILKFY